MLILYVATRAVLKKSKKKAEKKLEKEATDPVLRRFILEKRDGIRIWKPTILKLNTESARKVYQAGVTDRYSTFSCPFSLSLLSLVCICLLNRAQSEMAGLWGKEESYIGIIFRITIGNCS